MDESQPTVPHGYCQCGCGERTKTEQRRFLHGHGNRVRRKTERIRVEDRGHDSPCWIWQLKIDRDGYGREWCDGKDQPAHRAEWERVNGPIAAGLQLDHLCRNRACVNPAHLEPVTCAVNIRRGRQTKLTLEDAREIRRLDAEGLTRVQIAKEFGVSYSAVNNVVRGTHWRDA